MSKIRKQILEWLQIIAIIMAAFWALTNPIYQQFLSSISINLQSNLKVVGKHPKGIAIQATINIKNQGQRKAYLLKPFYIAFGKEIDKLEPEPKMPKQTANVMNENTTTIYRSFQPEKEKVEVVAFGCPFGDEQFEPDEEKDLEVLFFIPQDRYDYIEFSVYVPVMESESDVTLEWDVRGIKPLVTASFKMKGKKVAQSELETFTKNHGITNFDSKAMLSLWPSVKGNCEQQYSLATKSQQITVQN